MIALLKRPRPLEEACSTPEKFASCSPLKAARTRGSLLVAKLDACACFLYVGTSAADVMDSANARLIWSAIDLQPPQASRAPFHSISEKYSGPEV